MEMLSKYQAIVITGYTGITMICFSDFHEDVEKRMSRPVFTSEFGQQNFADELKKIYEEEFLAICHR